MTTAKEPAFKYDLHRGEDYLEVTTPSGASLTMNYPSDEDWADMRALVALANAALKMPRNGGAKKK